MIKMSLLNYSVFAQTIASAFINPGITNITQKLFGFLTSSQNILNKNGKSYDIDNQVASKWWNQKAPIPLNIRKALQQPDVEQAILKCFANDIWPELLEDKLEKPLNQLVLLIKEQAIDEEVKAELINLRNNKNIDDFLARTFILAVLQSDGQEAKNTAPSRTINKKSAQTDAKDEIIKKIMLFNRAPYKAPNLREAYFNGIDGGSSDFDLDFYIQVLLKTYIQKSVEYYSQKKTLLYAEKPHPFYDIYVCNDLKHHRPKSGVSDKLNPSFQISNATVELLENESNYIIIEGTGGIGKSMFQTHLFLSAADNFVKKDKGKCPVFLSLKDYKRTTGDMIDFICSTINSFEQNIRKEHIIAQLNNKRFVLLLDGLDEIQSSAKDVFDKGLESFIKSYPGNPIIMTSRPVNSFVSYAQFTLYDIESLNKNQALALIDKLEFWDPVAKQSFRNALDHELFYSHYEFASNPLLLTIMLMTYSTFGEVPAKMHVFYSKAYETMARLHDASKGAFKRPLHTHLTPEVFKKYFSEFCARTYADEMLEFTEQTFSSYMDITISKSILKDEITANDFLLDLTDNLCIMYREGETYSFIHRSFQEYFAAVYFSSVYDSKLSKIGDFFEATRKRSFTDRSFDMLYDMIPEKVARFIFFPFLQKKFAEWYNPIPDEMYWNFLADQYQTIHYEYGDTGNFESTKPKSFLYSFIAKTNNITSSTKLNDLDWPSEVFDMPKTEWVNAYVSFTDNKGFEKYPDPDWIPETVFEEVMPYLKDDLPAQYKEYFGDPDYDGLSIEIDTFDMHQNPDNYTELREFLTDLKFPIREEFEKLKEYYDNLQSQCTKESKSVGLFDD